MNNILLIKNDCFQKIILVKYKLEFKKLENIVDYTERLLQSFNNGVVLSDGELLELESFLKYYSDIPEKSWIHENLIGVELCLLQRGARVQLNSVQDIIKARNESKEIKQPWVV